LYLTPASSILLGFLCVYLSFYGLTAGELWRTESLRAIIAAEFLRTGNWIVPTLYGEPLFTKPPGMYAAIALVSWPMGAVTEWSARLPSALAASGLVFLFFLYFKKHVGRLGGLVAAGVLPMSLLWLDKATSAEIDMLQTWWVSAAILSMLCAVDAEDGQQKKGAGLWWLVALLCVACGVLTKWTAPAFFYGTVIPLLWWRGQLRLLLGRHHVFGAVCGAAVCFAWVAAAVALSSWDTFYGTVSREAMQRLSPSHFLEARQLMSPAHRHTYPWLGVFAQPFVILGASLPWSPIALLTLLPGFARRWDEKGRRLLEALHCWVWPNLLFWSLIPDHAPRHSFPIFPGIAGLAALVWMAWLQGKLSWLVPRVAPAQVLVGAVAVWLVVKVFFVHVIIPQRNANRDPRAKGELIASLVPANTILYLFRLKDEGIMFYFGREVRRLAGPNQLPSFTEPLYCILDETEWRQLQSSRRIHALKALTDEQGAPIMLARIAE
jgi:4-amino-4-deoxy-L-arabinose transferase-like glycosyltransferase